MHGIQIYLSLSNSSDYKSLGQYCKANIHTWMSQNKLKLTDAVSETVLFYVPVTYLTPEVLYVVYGQGQPMSWIYSSS